MNVTNELDTELLGLHALNSFVDKDSSGRSVMFSSHWSQRLVICGADEKRIQTGVEQDLSQYTFSVKMPVDGRVVRVIDRYPRRLDADAIPMNPETLVIYEDLATKELGCFSIPTFASYHQYFGFKYEMKPTVNKLVPGTFIESGTIFADASTVGEYGGYKYGINLNMAFMSHPAVSEDGILISRDVLDRLKFKVYETRVVEFGTNAFPLNLYGSRDYYKPFPELGEEIRDDGILMMLRNYDYDLMPVEISTLDVMEPDFIFDKAVYVRGPGGKVVDIRVFRDNIETSQTPFGVMGNVDKYSRALRRYYKEVVEAERQISMERKKKYGDGKVALKPELHRLIVEGMAILAEPNGKSSQRLNKVYRKAPLDDYRIEFVVEYELTPKEGFKLSDTHGGKAVICQIAEPEDMPVDAAGTRADIVMDGGSTINRMNVGRLYEHYFAAAAHDLTREIRQRLALPQQETMKALKQIKSLPTALVADVYARLLGFYALVSPRQHTFFSEQVSNEERLEHLAAIVADGIYIYWPIENTVSAPEAVRAVEQYYRPTYGPVTYTGNSGKQVTTEENVRIAPLYMMLLEKIADDWSSVSSGKLQHFQVLSPMTRSEKYAYPFRNSPVRTIGETEGRIFAGTCGREAIAEMMDRSNSPMTHKTIVMNILKAIKPMDIERAVDRTLIPLGGSKPIQLVDHIAMVAGYASVYEPPLKEKTK